MKRKASATVSEAEPQKTGETPTFGVTGQWPQRRVLQLPVTARLVRRNIWPIVASKACLSPRLSASSPRWLRGPSCPEWPDNELGLPGNSLGPGHVEGPPRPPSGGIQP